MARTDADVRFCLVCGAVSDEVGIGVPVMSTCALEDEDIGPWYAPTWEELNCLETLLDAGGDVSAAEEANVHARR